jgi:hypothetical protein
MSRVGQEVAPDGIDDVTYDAALGIEALYPTAQQQRVSSGEELHIEG